MDKQFDILHKVSDMLHKLVDCIHKQVRMSDRQVDRVVGKLVDSSCFHRSYFRCSCMKIRKDQQRIQPL